MHGRERERRVITVEIMTIYMKHDTASVSRFTVFIDIIATAKLTDQLYVGILRTNSGISGKRAIGL